MFRLLVPTANMVGVDQKEDLDASAALTLHPLRDIFWIGLYAMLVMLAATAVVALRTRAVLPRWLAWSRC